MPWQSVPVAIGTMNHPEDTIEHAIDLTNAHQQLFLRLAGEAVDERAHELRSLAKALEVAWSGLAFLKEVDSVQVMVRARRHEANPLVELIGTLADIRPTLASQTAAEVLRVAEAVVTLTEDIFEWLSSGGGFDASEPQWAGAALARRADLAREREAIRYRARALSGLEEIEALRIEVQELRDRAIVDADQASDAKHSAEAAAGSTGVVQIAEHFKTLADHELKQANQLRWSAIGMLVASAVFAGVVVYVSGGDDSDVLRRLSVSALAFLLGLYLTREAAHHRGHGRWARTIEVQLKTMDAFASPMSAEGRESLRSLLAARTFASGPHEAPASGGGDVLDTHQVADQIIARLTRP